MKEILLTSSILILALVLLRAVFRRAIPQRVQYALWGLVLLRLLIPFSIPFGAQSLAAQAKPMLSAVENVGEIPVYTQDLGTAPLDAYPGAVAFEPGESFTPRDVPRTDPTLHPNYAVRSEDGSGLSLYKGLPLSELLRYGWYIGMAGMAAWFLITNVRFMLVLRRTRRVLSGKNRVYVSSAIASPCLVGLFRPAIYVTPEAAQDKVRLRHVLIHEKTHLRHLDPLWTLLRAVCLIVYFFDPLVWLAAYLSEIDGELACDEGTLVVLGEDERSAYGETLLALAAMRRVSPPMLASTSMVSDKKQMRERITRIAEHRRPIAAAAVIAILVSGAILLAVNPDARAAVKSWVREVFRAHTVYQFTKDAEQTALPDYELSYLPEGFEEIVRMPKLIGKAMIYAPDFGRHVVVFHYYLLSEGRTIRISYDKGDSPEKVEIRGLSGDYFANSRASSMMHKRQYPYPGNILRDYARARDIERTNTLIWIDETKDIVFILVSDLEKDVMLRIAEGVVLQDPKD